MTQITKSNTALSLDVMNAGQLVARINTIRDISSQIMRDGTHYGAIPSVEKKVLLKAGAELLAAAFQLSIEYDIFKTEHDGGHREYMATCELKYIPTGVLVSTGTGMCSTMESKYAWRKGEGEDTGKTVPKEYWDLRKERPNDALALLGGKGYGAKKIDGVWKIVKDTGERVTNPDLADQYNTVLKMAQKRALVAAVLNATGCSDEFTQDVEDFIGHNIHVDAATGGEPLRAEPAKAKPAKQSDTVGVQTVFEILDASGYLLDLEVVDILGEYRIKPDKMPEFQKYVETVGAVWSGFARCEEWTEERAQKMQRWLCGMPKQNVLNQVLGQAEDEGWGGLFIWAL